MITCNKCGANCDPGEIVGGQCLDCMEQERRIQSNSENAFKGGAPGGGRWLKRSY